MKYHKIIQGLESMADIQLQIQNIIKLADTANNQLADIKTTLLQTEETHRTHIIRDIYNISKELGNIIYREKELMNTLKYYKKCIKKHIKTLHNQWLLIKKKKKSFKIKKCFYTNYILFHQNLTDQQSQNLFY